MVSWVVEQGVQDRIRVCWFVYPKVIEPATAVSPAKAGNACDSFASPACKPKRFLRKPASKKKIPFVKKKTCPGNPSCQSDWCLYPGWVQAAGSGMVATKKRQGSALRHQQRGRTTSTLQANLCTDFVNISCDKSQKMATPNYFTRKALWPWLVFPLIPMETSSLQGLLTRLLITSPSAYSTLCKNRAVRRMSQHGTTVASVCAVLPC